MWDNQTPTVRWLWWTFLPVTSVCSVLLPAPRGLLKCGTATWPLCHLLMVQFWLQLYPESVGAVPFYAENHLRQLHFHINVQYPVARSKWGDSMSGRSPCLRVARCLISGCRALTLARLSAGHHLTSPNGSPHKPGCVWIISDNSPDANLMCHLDRYVCFLFPQTAPSFLMEETAPGPGCLSCKSWPGAQCKEANVHHGRGGGEGTNCKREQRPPAPHRLSSDAGRSSFTWTLTFPPHADSRSPSQSHVTSCCSWNHATGHCSKAFSGKQS